MPHFICGTCGAQFAESPEPPESCPICADERQYIGAGGQTWTTMEQLSADRRNVIREIEPGLRGIGSEPSFAIGQRAMLICTPRGNVLWDCISFLDDETVRAVQAVGGISAIAISHPHYYSSMVEWSRRFGAAPIWLHEDDRRWVMRPDPAIRFWTGERHDLLPGLTLVRCGGHFPGSSVLAWEEGADGRGTLHTGDTIYVVPDRGWVSFMYSYPNHIPLSPAEVTRIVETVRPLPFDRIYGAWWQSVIDSGGKEAVERSARRYIDRVGTGINGTASTGARASSDSRRR